MSRSSLTIFAALALVLAGGLAWWSLSRPRGPSVAGPTAAAPERSQSGIAPTLVTPASIFPEPSPLAEEPAAPLDPPTAKVAVRHPVAAIESPLSAPLDVVVLDARTGVGLPFFRLRARQGKHRASAQVDRNGLAKFTQPFDAGDLDLTLWDGLNALSLETTIQHSPVPSGGPPPTFEWPIDVGPTYGLRIDAGAISPDAHLQAMLCELGADGVLRTWGSQGLPRDSEGQRWLRYQKVEQEPSAGWKPFLRVWVPETFLSGEVPVPSTVGLHEGLVVALRATAGGLRGRVTDTEGLAVSARVVVLGGRPEGMNFDDGDRSWLDLQTDEEGNFEAPAVAPGTHQVMVCSSRRPIVRAEVSIALGAVTERRFVVASEVSGGRVGDVRGALLSNPGAGEPNAILELDSVDGRGVSRATGTATFYIFGDDPDGEERNAYEFTDLPMGRYRVRVVPLDGRTYVPSEQVVEVPAAGVDFATEQTLAETTVRFRTEVIDAETGDPVSGTATLIRLGSYWIGEFAGPWFESEPVEGPRELDGEMVIGAPGYVPVRVRNGDYAQVGGLRVYRVGLRRGHGIALVVADVDAANSVAEEEEFGDVLPARGVPGARVLIDGHAYPVGPDGLALIETGAPINSVQVEAPGWSTLATHGFQGQPSPPVGLGFVLMARE